MILAERLLPQVLSRLYPSLIWRMPKAEQQAVYLSFDDGPDPEVTPRVLDMLAGADVRATFFCLGKNVVAYPEIYQRIVSDGHAVGNHTFHHRSGWKTSCVDYIQDVDEAARYIKSKLFRPPYGKITRKQAAAVIEKGFTIMMWDVLSKDYLGINMKEGLTTRVLGLVRDGSVVVLHDSAKAAPALLPALPEVLKRLKGKGYALLPINCG